MPTLIRIPVFLLLVGGQLACSTTDSRDGPRIFELLSYHQPERFEDSLLVGTYHVFEDRAAGAGRKIPLYIAVTPALDRSNLKEPIFMIDGGPGLGVSHWAFFFTEIDSLYRRYHDLVYVDVRGTGQSSPLHCHELQTKSTLQDHFEDPFPVDDLDACLNRYADSVNFNNYNTQFIVDDLDEVRAWLGYDKINLFGLSYGGKVALSYMDQYPHSIHRVVLQSPSLPTSNNQLLRATWSQQALDKLFDKCLKDSACHKAFPDIKSEFLQVQARIKNELVVAQFGPGTDDTISLSWHPIAHKIYSLLYTDSGYRRLPFLIHEAYKGNYEPFLDEFHSSQEPAVRFADGMFLSVICAESIRIDADASNIHNTFLGDYIYQTRLAACNLWPVTDKSSAFSEPVTSEIPTLIISGALDPVTPPETAREILRHLKNGRHIIAPHMAHVFTELSNIECFDTYVVAFFAGTEGAMDKGCFESMTPKPFQITAVE